MKKIAKMYLSSTAIFYMIIVLGSAILNIVSGFEKVSNISLLEIFVYLILCDIVDYFFMDIHFKKKWQYNVIYAITIYAILLILAYFFDWFEFSVKGIFSVTVIFVLIYLMMKWYYTIIESNEADEINEMLRK